MLEEFTARHRVRVKRAEDGEAIVPGRLGHIYEHGDGLLGVMVIPGKRFVWANARRRLEAAEFTVWQDGGEEGSALFDPEDAEQARLALKVIKVKRRRCPSAAQLATLRRGREARRISLTPLDKRARSGQETTISPAPVSEERPGRGFGENYAAPQGRQGGSLTIITYGPWKKKGRLCSEATANT